MLKILKLRMRLWWYKLLIKLGIKSDEIYYIGGSAALPPPLSKEEEKELLELLPKGDKSARAVLIERNLRLVVYIARKFEKDRKSTRLNSSHVAISYAVFSLKKKKRIKRF